MIKLCSVSILILEFLLYSSQNTPSDRQACCFSLGYREMTMSPAVVELPLPESPPDRSNFARFSNLRGVRWRIDLGILPASPSASIEELRRVAADSRRRYASVRRRLHVYPHLSNDVSRSPDLTLDNPLSQNPESNWGRFFRNAELEKLVDKDLSRLYPEHDIYFQTPACQAILRRILQVWCLGHPEYGYRQGMYELLAPLLNVLHADLQHLSKVRVLFENCFSDGFDEMDFPEGDMPPNCLFTKSSSRGLRTDVDNFDEEGDPKVISLDDLDPETKEVFWLSDAYGAEGELGVILSERFLEHDAYCMFDGLMSGAHGAVEMSDFFSPSPAIGSITGLPPVIEASSALYHLLSIVDSSLHSHLIELGVEPQYFALRWLRVLFCREFTLDNILLIWDELFSSSNTSSVENELECSFKILCSPRGALISAVSVSLLLHLRSSLLATENTTSCLQRLLSSPKNIDVKILLKKAKSCLVLALGTNVSSYPAHNSIKPEIGGIRSLPTNAGSTVSPNQSLPDSYWEEKWRVLHKEMATQKSPVSRGKIKKLLGDKFGLTRKGSNSSPAKKDSRSSTVDHRLIDDLSEVDNKREFNGFPELVNRNESPCPELDEEKSLLGEPTDHPVTEMISNCTVDETCLSGENSSVFSTANSPHSMGSDHDNDSENSTVTSNSFVGDNDEEASQVEEKSIITSNSSVADNDDEANQVVEIIDMEAASTIITAASSTHEAGPSKDGELLHGVGLKDRKPLSGKFQWLLRFRRAFGEGNLEKEASVVENACKQIHESSNSEYNSCGEGGSGDKEVMGTLKNLGQSMLGNIQVIESVFQQDRDHAGNILGGNGQATAMAALKELHKISNLLSGM